MSVAAAADNETPAPACDFCTGSPPVVYCRADSARLCLPCDRHVHGANTVSTRHARAPLCAACRAAAAAAAFRPRLAAPAKAIVAAPAPIDLAPGAQLGAPGAQLGGRDRAHHTVPWPPTSGHALVSKGTTTKPAGTHS
ncbi:hypothetical protein HU200_010028 [Digitaria exilis]|uniref:B box-type domain-containing protein n=1 Tax=Digitaria exilis TaxID=1010633 RepID=A0A835FKU6_9POAL|nr:hypothetical protein HU200_010028 [Digitaria exilis]